MRETVYFIQCECLKLYMGMSTRSLCTYIVGHWSKIRHKVLDAPLVSHFLEPGHSEEGFKFCVKVKLTRSFYHQIDEVKALSCMEAYWIYMLKSYAPFGLNQSIDFTSFL